MSVVTEDKAIAAMLGAAYGDALGWPNERRGMAKAKKENQPTPLKEFIQWTRLAGGRFYPYEETVEAGEYSDDTQLILCLSRAFLRGGQWWDHWTKIELPFWVYYERGGGRATKSAANAWLSGKTPWALERKPKEISSYFEAGGNGVAMRILPHLLHNATMDTYEPVAKSIFLDGISTHGHPRALIGALAYGFAIWKGLKQTTPLEYGKIINETLAGSDTWGKIPSTELMDKEWLAAANQYSPNFEDEWKRARNEMIELLIVGKEALSKGVFTIDDDVLRALHCFDSKISGAGTVAAAASIYLASRYASDPTNGVVKAAFAIGSDTDTIASMTGGLLGIVCGSSWLAPIKTKVQDSQYLAELAQGLLQQKHNLGGMTFGKVKFNDWLNTLLDCTAKQHIDLPDQRKAEIIANSTKAIRDGKYKVNQIKLRVGDGQTLYFVKIVRDDASGRVEPHSFSNQMPLLPQSIGSDCGAKIVASSLEGSAYFYEKILGVGVKKRTRNAIVFDKGLSIVPKSYLNNLPKGIAIRSIVYIQVKDIAQCYLSVNQNKIKVISPLASWGGAQARLFRCFDPDQNIVEVFSTSE